MTARPGRGLPRRSVLQLGLFALAGAPLLAGCGVTGAPAPRAAGGPPRRGGTLRFAILDAPANLDPHSGSSYPESIITTNTSDKLTYQDPRTGEILPWLATSWQVNNTLTEYTFQLREGVSFSDGTPFTADSVKENFDILGLGNKQLGVAKVTAYWSDYLGTRVLGSHTVVVSFNKPNAGFLQATSHYFSGIVGHSTLLKSKAERARPENIVTTGPFTVAEHVYQERTVLVRRPDYNWAPPGSAHSGPAYLDRVEFLVIPEASVRTGALHSGDIHASLDVQPTDEKPLAASGFQVLSQLIAGRDIAFDFRLDKPPTDEWAVRRAVQLGWDRAALRKAVLTDSYRISTSLIAQNVPGYQPFDAISYRPDEAVRVLEEAGWTLRGSTDGIRVRNGKPLVIEMLGGANLVINTPAYELIQQYLKKIGIQLNLTVLPLADWVAEQTIKGKWNINAGNTSRADPAVLDQLYSPLIANNGKLAKDFPGNPDLVGSLAAIETTLDPAKRAEITARAQDLLLNTYALTAPVYTPAQVVAASPKVHDLRFEIQSRNLFYDTWIES